MERFYCFQSIMLLNRTLLLCRVDVFAQSEDFLKTKFKIQWRKTLRRKVLLYNDTVPLWHLVQLPEALR